MERERKNLTFLRWVSQEVAELVSNPCPSPLSLHQRLSNFCLAESPAVFVRLRTAESHPRPSNSARLVCISNQLLEEAHSSSEDLLH